VSLCAQTIKCHYVYKPLSVTMCTNHCHYVHKPLSVTMCPNLCHYVPKPLSLCAQIIKCHYVHKPLRITLHIFVLCDAAWIRRFTLPCFPRMLYAPSILPALISSTYRHLAKATSSEARRCRVFPNPVLTSSLVPRRSKY
jgi:hypothetical protein